MAVISNAINALTLSFSTMKSSKATAEITMNMRNGVDIGLVFIFWLKLRLNINFVTTTKILK
ncbi:hypothetical protein MASR2M47_43040 [Draconibacterium sp.]